MTDTVLLNEYIEKSGLKKKKIAELLSLSQNTLSQKIGNRRQFKASEIASLCGLLNIDSTKDKERIFFAQNVEFNSTMA